MKYSAWFFVGFAVAINIWIWVGIGIAMDPAHAYGADERLSTTYAMLPIVPFLTSLEFFGTRTEEHSSFDIITTHKLFDIDILRITNSYLGRDMTWAGMIIFHLLGTLLYVVLPFLAWKYSQKQVKNVAA